MQRVARFGFCSVIRRVLLACVAFILSGQAFAAAPIYTWGMDQAYSFFPLANRAESPGGLCSDFAAARNRVDTVNISSCSGQVQGPASLYITRTDVPGTIIQYGIKRYAKCYDGSEPLSGKPENEQCGIAPPPPPAKCEVAAGTEFTFSSWMGSGPLNSNSTFPNDPGVIPKTGKNCVLEGTPTSVEECYSQPSADGKVKRYYCVWKAISSGALAQNPVTNDENPPVGPPTGPTAPSPPVREPMPPTPSSQCPKGSVMAGYNTAGTPMCVGNGAAPTNAPAAQPVSVTKTTTSNADGSTTTTTNTVTTNADGSKTTVTDKVTVAAASAGGGTSTSQTKVTSTTPSGAAGTETKPQDVNFCKQNPTLSICRESSVSGSCGQTSCMGDAIQCATLRAAAAMQCAQKADEDAMKARPEVALGNSILAGADPMKSDIDAMLKGTEVDLSKPSLDQAGFIGGGSCLANRSISFMGKAVPLNFTQLCTNIQPLRAVIMALAFLTAYMLVSRSVLQS